MDFLSKYKPEVSVFSQFEVDKSLPEEDYAFAIWQKLIQAKRGHQVLFLVIGKLLKEIKEQKIYLKLDYESFEQFLGSEEICWSREAAFMFMRVYEYYIEKLKLPEEKVASITLTKLSMMIPMTKGMDRDKAIEKIEELSALRHNDFMIRSKQEKDDDKPIVWYSKELEKWVVEYFSDKTNLVDRGTFKEFQEL